jgi:hypothetical protein
MTLASTAGSNDPIEVADDLLLQDGAERLELSI